MRSCGKVAAMAMEGFGGFEAGFILEVLGLGRGVSGSYFKGEK